MVEVLVKIVWVVEVIAVVWWSGYSRWWSNWFRWSRVVQVFQTAELVLQKLELVGVMVKV